MDSPPVRTPPANGPGSINVAIIGAGVSGLCSVIRLKHHFANSGVPLNITVYERNEDVSGTWYLNHYPGAACDVPSHFYCFSFEPNPEFSAYYAPQAEIHRYLSGVAKKHNVYQHIQFRTEFLGARWDEASASWILRTCVAGSEGSARPVISEPRAHFLIISAAALNRPAVPDFPGLSTFSGKVFHTSRWDDNFDPTGKRIGVIGTGASAVQVIPELAPAAKELHVFQRTPGWAVPRGNYTYPSFVKFLFRYVPFLLWLYRIYVWISRDIIFFPAFKRGTIAERVVKWLCESHLEKQVPDPVLRKALTPDYPPGCKRLLVTTDYFTSLALPHSHLVTSGISRIDKTGVVTVDGAHHECDTLVMATGFQVTSFLSHLDIVGRNGLALADKWRDPNNVEAYHGTMITGCPNAFVLMGPNTALGHSSMIFIIESQVEYMCAVMHHMFTTGARIVDVKVEAHRAYNRWLQSGLSDTVWAGSCHSWYKTDSGKIVTLWPHSTLRFWWTLRTPKVEDMVFE